MAGGTVNWIISTKPKRGSDGSNPIAPAALIAPTQLSKGLYLTTMITMLIMGLMLAFLKPVQAIKRIV